MGSCTSHLLALCWFFVQLQPLQWLHMPLMSNCIVHCYAFPVIPHGIQILDNFSIIYHFLMNQTSRHNTMSNNKCNQKAYCMEFRAQIINCIKKGESEVKLSQELNTAASTVGDWKKQSVQILKSHSELHPMSANTTKRLHLSAQPTVGKCLLQWYKNMQKHQHPPPISRSLLQAQVKIFARKPEVPHSRDASNGFIGHWCHRYI